MPVREKKAPTLNTNYQLVEPFHSHTLDVAPSL